ncbi:MAG: hypothetical protein NVSMB55_28430 [Mycobacteriales bacterium]
MPAPLAVDFQGPVTDGVRTVTTFVPKLIGFLVILLVGYLIAKAVEKIIDKVLQKVGFDRLVERGGIKAALDKSQYDAASIVGKIAFIFIFVAALAMAFGTLGIAALDQPFAQLLALLPKILVALVIIVIGAAMATAAKKFLGNILGGLSYGSGVATAVSIIVLVLFAKAALDEVGIATTVTNAVLYTALAMIAGVTIVGVGGGLIKPMQTRWEDGLNKASQEKENIRAQVQQSATPSPTYGTAAGQPATAPRVVPVDARTRVIRP